MYARIPAVALSGCIVFAGLLAGCSPVRWETDYQSGIRSAVGSNKRALVQFYSGMNADARAMDDEVFSDPDVQRLMTNFVSIRVDNMLNRDLAQQYNVQMVPAFFVVRPDMTVAGSAYGKMDANKFRVFLIKHTYD